MSYTAISVRSLAKEYTIGKRRVSYTLSGSIGELFGSNLLRSLKERTRKNKFWALKDVSFDIRQGEVVGVIGHNGAGKSTLLKILSRITQPTSGTADIYGRVGSLLEVGTGFNFELTGRENVYLNGAILGMKKREIDRRFDEIVAFANVDDFIDTQVKHYSSGMHLRLAFAVAAHLESEILLVDEVLAVGDMAFQKKCLNKMDSVASEGRTVLFVSHNMGAVKELCRSALVLKNGEVDYFGPVVGAIHHYSSAMVQEHPMELDEGSAGWLGTRFSGAGQDSDEVDNDKPLDLCSRLVVPDDLNYVVLHCIIENEQGDQTVHNYTKGLFHGRGELGSGRYEVKLRVPPLWLRPGVYTVYLKLIGQAASGESVKWVSERVVVGVRDNTGIFTAQVRATVMPPVDWDVSLLAAESQGMLLDGTGNVTPLALY